MLQRELGLVFGRRRGSIAERQRGLIGFDADRGDRAYVDAAVELERGVDDRVRVAA
jgi:hypothetical protein